jgi:hypothetical protein
VYFQVPPPPPKKKSALKRKKEKRNISVLFLLLLLKDPKAAEPARGEPELDRFAAEPEGVSFRRGSSGVVVGTTEDVLAGDSEVV